MTRKLTVLLTVYNGMPYLPRTVASVLGQRLASEDNFCFLLVNNGSTDGSAEFLRSLRADSPESKERREGLQDPHGPQGAQGTQGAQGAQGTQGTTVRLLDLKQNIGRTPVLNLALEHVDTPYTAIIDADDLALPGRLEAQLRFLEEHREIALLGSNVRYIDENDKPVGQSAFPDGHAALCRRLPLYNQFAHAACMFRTEAVKNAGGYPAEFHYAQDFALWLKLFARGHKAASLPGFYAAIRIHPGQATRSEAYRQARAADELALGPMMLALPDFPAESRQLALLRLAVTRWRMGDKSGAGENFRQALKEYWLPLNPLLWMRAFEETRRLPRQLLRRAPR